MKYNPDNPNLWHKDNVIKMFSEQTIVWGAAGLLATGLLGMNAAYGHISLDAFVNTIVRYPTETMSVGILAGTVSVGARALNGLIKRIQEKRN